jgi:glycosyltransferase involved in cell wall biosynthesis
MRLLYIAFPNSVHTLKWVNHFKRDHEIMLVGFYPTYPIEGVDLRYLPVSHPGLALTKLLEVRKLIREFKPDILHAHYATSCGSIAAFSGFHPFIMSVWGDDIKEFPLKSPLHKWLIGKVLRSADKITATSRMLAQSANRLLRAKREISVIPFGVDLKQYKFKSREKAKEVHIGTVRNLMPKYGLEFLIKAFADLKNSGNEIRLTVVGDGELRPKLEALTLELKMGEFIRFAGFVPNHKVVDYLHKFDIFAIPSVGEGETFGVAAVEAMATGLPVVASRIGGLPEVVDHDINGLLIQPGDVQSLALALKAYIDDPELRLEHGLKGREKVENFYNWNENAKLMEDIYDEVLTR